MSVNVKINNSFVSEKISRIRFLQENLNETNKFITGSWDSRKNYLRLYAITSNEDEEFSPVCLAKHQTKADVTGLELLGADHIFVSSSDGNLALFQLSPDRDNLREVAAFPGLHKFQDGSEAACTGISIFEENVASVGEDGSLNIVSAAAKTLIKALSSVDSCSLTCVAFVNHKEVLTGNRMGIIKVFDIRTDEQQPTVSMAVSCEDDKKSNALMSLASHPTQNHIILCGSEEGSLSVFDLRQPLFPASYLMAHSSAICEIAFHRTEPSKLFTASENGELWQWNTMPTYDLQTDGGNPWLALSERAKNKINVSGLNEC